MSSIGEERSRGPGGDAHGGEGKEVFFGYRRVRAEEKIHLVQRHFDTIAGKYDFMNTLLSFGLHHLWKRAAVRMMKLREGERVVDLCGGTGDLAILAARAVGSGGRVILCDINRAMMMAGLPKVARSKLGSRIQYVQGDAERVCLAAGQFDAAMVGFGIRNLTRLEGGFEEIYRILKPKGRLMCLEFSLPTMPIFRWLYDLYSFHVMPLAGKWFVGACEAYTYLPESIRTFPRPRTLAAVLRGIGFTDVTYRKLADGIAVVHLAVKGG